MSRLWPERLYVGLAGVKSWLAEGNNGQLLPPTTLPVGTGPAELLDAVLQSAPARNRPSKLSLMLPSHYAQSTSLPWSANLRSNEERQAYAQVYLVQAGLGTGDGHAIHAEFRHYSALGFAYAVPRLLLEDLHAVAARHALSLTTVLPVTAIAHLAARRARGFKPELSVIVEEAVISALVMGRAGLQRCDAEPVVAGQQKTLHRLLTRIGVDGEEFEAVHMCLETDDKTLAGIASAFAMNAPVRTVTPSQWRRFL